MLTDNYQNEEDMFLTSALLLMDVNGISNNPFRLIVEEEV